MARFIAGKTVKLGYTHYEPGELLPEKVQTTAGGDVVALEKLSNFRECMRDGTFKPAPREVLEALAAKEDELDVDDGDKGKGKGRGEQLPPLHLPTLKEWTSRGYGLGEDKKPLEGEPLQKAYEKFIDGLRSDAKRDRREVVEPK